MNTTQLQEIDRIRPKLINYLKSKFHISYDLIEDSIQHSIMKIIRYTKPIKNIYSFCLKIASNYLQDILKSKSFRIGELKGGLECQSPRISNEQRETLSRINALDLEFLLDYTEKKNLEKWAEEFGIKVGSLSMRWSRLIKKYKAQLGVL